MAGKEEYIPNLNIGRDLKKDEKVQLNIGSFNIACADRDDAMNPLVGRVDAIIDQINAVDPPLDCVVLLEAGRTSKGVEFTEIACQIQKGTGLTYMGIDYVNGTVSPFGKAVFIRRSTCMLIRREHHWLHPKGVIVDGSHFGTDHVTLHLAPVVEEEVECVVNDKIVVKNLRRVIRNAVKRITFVLFPMDLKGRMEAIQVTKALDSDLLMGDWNTFPDEGGPEMIAGMESAGWNSILPVDVMTFKAWDHDINVRPSSFREKLNPESKILSENEDGSLNILFSSVLDHVFVKQDANFRVYVDVYGTGLASDHMLIAACLSYPI